MLGQITLFMSTMLEVIIILGILFGLVAAIGNIAVTQVKETDSNIQKLALVDAARSMMGCVSAKSHGKLGSIDAKDRVKLETAIEGCRKSSGLSYTEFEVYTQTDKTEKFLSGTEGKSVPDNIVYMNADTSSGLRQGKIYVQK